ncbi:hypothetical protein L7F22_044477 [Adiantum nelumboides]|nr:hypothetical protein [Adiantum nelumboides]
MASGEGQSNPSTSGDAGGDHNEDFGNDDVRIQIQTSFSKPGPISDRGILEAISFFVVIFVGSFSIGAMAGILSALLFKYGGFQEKELRILESCLVILFPYLAYNVEDALELSGIVSILFAGITMKYYTAPNISSQAQQITTSFFQMLSKLSETFVYDQ